MTRKTKITLAGLAASVAAAAVLAVLALGAGAHHPRAQAIRPAASTAPAPVPSPDANTLVCRKLARLAAPLEAVLTGAAANPAAAAAQPGARASLRQAASLLQAWSKTANDGFDGRKYITLGFDLSIAADQLRIAAAGMTDPNAATYAADALKGVTKADDDCAALGKK